MADAESITFTGEQHRGVGTRFECRTRIGPFRTNDRMVVTEWEPGRVMGIEHHGLFTGTGRFTLDAVGPAAHALHVDRDDPTSRGGWAVPVGARARKPIFRQVWRGQPRR